MLETITYRKWKFHADPVATREAYRMVPKGSTDTCGCPACLNFAAQKDRIYPPKVLALFQKLGIDPTKEIEVYHVLRLASGRHLYGGWLQCVGSLQTDTEATNADTFDLEKVNDQFQMGCTYSNELYWEPFAEKPLIQIEFAVEAPWQLEDAEEPE